MNTVMEKCTFTIEQTRAIVDFLVTKGMMKRTEDMLDYQILCNHVVECVRTMKRILPSEVVLGVIVHQNGLMEDLGI